jgi:hypothetical protein
MFDCETPEPTRRRLANAATDAIFEDRMQKGLYSRIADTLWEEGLRDYYMEEGKAIGRAYCKKLKRQAQQKRARTQKKKMRAQKKISSR